MLILCRHLSYTGAPLIAGGNTMLSLQALSDRAEIQDLMVRYSYCIDDGDWDGLDAVFTPDAVIDYTQTGGTRGAYPEIKRFLARVLPRFPGYQHASVCTQICVDGDHARARTIVFNPMLVDHEGTRRVFFVGAWYLDTLVRTSAGWRIRERIEKASWDFNTPEEFAMPGQGG